MYCFVTYSSVSLILTVFTRRSLCELREQGRTGHLAYRAYARWTVQYWGRSGAFWGPKNEPKCPSIPFRALKMHQSALKCLKNCLCGESPRGGFWGILGHFGASLGHNAWAKLWSQSAPVCEPPIEHHWCSHRSHRNSERKRDNLTETLLYVVTSTSTHNKKQNENQTLSELL